MHAPSCSFEQLCINYCNETLQQFFVHHIFKMEQAEYDKERIDWAKIAFVDNQPTLDMLADKPMNVLALVDEEAKFPKGTDETLLEKLHGKWAKHEKYIKPKSSSDKRFGISHFAGAVHYDVNGFLEKNRDTFSTDLFSVLNASKNPFLVSLFQLTPAKGEETRKRTGTLGMQFKKSLDDLMATLNACNPFFVRCVKPNENKARFVPMRWAITPSASLTTQTHTHTIIFV